MCLSLVLLAGFDGYKTDPLGGQLSLSTADYSWATTMVRYGSFVCTYVHVFIRKLILS